MKKLTRSVERFESCNGILFTTDKDAFRASEVCIGDKLTKFLKEHTDQRSFTHTDNFKVVSSMLDDKQDLLVNLKSIVAMLEFGEQDDD